MPRLTQRQKRRIKEELRKERGDKCHAGLVCKHISGAEYREKAAEDFLLDHIDNNDLHNSLSNLQLICRACNAKKNPRGKSRFHNEKYVVRERGRQRERVGKSQRAYVILDRMKNGLTFEQKKNIEGEYKFKEWIERKVKGYGYWPLEDVINAGAVVADVSVQTTERWMKKLVSSEGRYSTHTMREDNEIVLIFKGKIPKENPSGPSQHSESGFDSSAESR